MKKQVVFLSLLIFFITTLPACFFNCVEGSGQVIRKQRLIPEFSFIEVQDSYDVFINQGKERMVEIEIDDNLMEKVETKVRRDKLIISTDGCIKKTTRKNIYITVVNFEGINITGACEVTGKGKLKGEDVELEISGSGDMKLDIEAQNLETDISGSGSLVLSGNCDNHDIEISGSGRLKAFKLISNEVEVEVTGSGNCELFANYKIKAEITGSGDLLYKGNPEKVDTDVTGSGSIKQVNESDN